MNLMYMLMYMMMHESHVSLLMSYLGRNRWTDAPIDEIDVQSAQHTGEPARCWPMLTEMLEMLAQILEQMLEPLRCWLRCLGPDAGADAGRLLADVVGLGR
jgi:hypothetical protein